MVLDAQRPDPGPRLRRDSPVLSAARMGRARSGGDLSIGGAARPRGARGGARPARRRARDRNHQSARDLRGMGTQERPPGRIARSYGNAAAAPRSARRCGREAEVTPAHRPAARSLFFRHQAQVAARQRPHACAGARARGELCFGTIDIWLIFKLSRGAAFVTDFTNASRTMLLNLERAHVGRRDARMLGVPPAMLPEPVSSRGPLAEAAARHVRPARRSRSARLSAINSRRSIGQGAVSRRRRPRRPTAPALSC